MSSERFDAIIIGAGMSGLSAGIRLSMFGKKALILESHRIPGGLNSFYRRGKRNFDVGLHALTNFAVKKEKGRPLTKLLKQLRIPYEALQLSEQNYSQIHFPFETINFTNDLNSLKSEIADKFPSQTDGFIKLLDYIENFNEVALDHQYQSAKEVVGNYLTDQKLIEMLFCPILIYGSAWENDIDFSQFVIMFKSIFVEGFARPDGGVRTIISMLENRLEEVGGEIRYGAKVSKIETNENKISAVHLENGERLETKLILSSAGIAETYSLVDQEMKTSPRVGRMSFTESILMTPKKPKDLDLEPTIIFYNNHEKYDYSQPETLFDNRSAVLCFPNNFKRDDQEEGVLRATFMANFDRWNALDKPTYKQQKEIVYQESLKTFQQFLPIKAEDIVFKDVFTPTTVKRYTGHFGGCVYGSIDKSRDGRTPVEGLAICGTDQGFLGIIGSILSGISMANLHGLMEGA